MPVKVFCTNPACDASFSLDETRLNSSVRCAKCGRTFVADATSSVPPTRGDSGADHEIADTRPLDLDIPNPFGKYRVIKQLGRGGMGAVFLVYDDDLDRPVALKIPFASGQNSAEILERFNREKRAAASLERHPHFCPIYEAGKIDNRAYLAMAFVDGKELSSLVDRDRPMNPQQAAKLVAKIALAMADAHDKGIIHRDLKPSNVMIDKRGEPIIMDFGLARRDGTSDAELTGSNAMLGTVYYMSPEQVRGEKALMGPASDLYSLGVILYELLTGRRPFEGPAMAVLGAIMMDSEPPSASERRPGLDKTLVAICHKAMSRKIADRHASMREFAAALDPSTPPLQPRKKRGNSIVRGLGVALLTGLVAVVLGIVIYVATDKGTLRIEGAEPGMVVRIDGHITRIEKVGETITVGTGEHGILIKRGDTVVTAPEEFVIKRGKETVLRITLEPKEVVKGATPEMPIAAESIDPITTLTPEPPKAVPPPPDEVFSPSDKVKSVPSKKKASSGFPPTDTMKKDEDGRPPASASSFNGLIGGHTKTLKVGNVAVVFSWCPASTFTMGSRQTEANRSTNEGPVEVKFTKGFWMMQTEMTQELCEAIGCKNDSRFKGPKLPMETVSYAEAKECAIKLTKKLRETGELPSSWEIRLPTEAQWEHAARAWSTRTFPLGDQLDSTMANFDGNSPYGGTIKGKYLEKTRAVGSYRPNNWGLYDTMGNVAEWTLDAYEAQLPGGDDPFVKGEPGTGRVIRGGGWNGSARDCRSASRTWSPPGLWRDFLGFRLAAVPTGL